MNHYPGASSNSVLVQDDELARRRVQEHTDFLPMEDIIDIIGIVPDRDGSVSRDPPLEHAPLVVSQPCIRVNTLGYIRE